MIRLEGKGLRTGATCAVRFERAAGPLRLRQGAHEALLADLRVVDGTRATTVAAGSLRVATVEHLFAALAAASVREDLVVHVEGEEIPLLDGASRAFLDAILALGIAPTPPRLRVVREGSVEVGASRYAFALGAGVSLEAAIDFGDARLAPSAAWDGTLDAFRREIAASRTFAFAREIEGLAAQGLVAHVPKESAVLIADDEILAAGAPFTPEEPARHKLLDLAGDLFLWGGPPVGRLHASRPGHAATHEAMEKALHDGIVEQAEFTRV